MQVLVYLLFPKQHLQDFSSLLSEHIIHVDDTVTLAPEQRRIYVAFSSKNISSHFIV